MATIVSNKNFSRREVDCAEYSGDLVFDHCNMVQENQDTPAGSIFINTDNLTSLTLHDCNCINHRPTASINYTGRSTPNDQDLSQYENLKVRTLFVDRSQTEKKKVWRHLVIWLGLNPNATLPEFKAWFVANQGDTIFFADTFIKAVREEINEQVEGIVDWDTFKTWVLNNIDKPDIGRVL